MRAAGVQILSMFAVACELMRDWRNTPGQVELLPFFDTYVTVHSSLVAAPLMSILTRYLPEYGFLTRAHDAAVLNGTLSAYSGSPLDPAPSKAN